MLVVHVAFECAPIYKTGGLGDVVGSLPIDLEKEGIDTVIVLPEYGYIKRPSTLPGTKIPVLYAPGNWLTERNIRHDPKIQALKYAQFALATLELIKSKGIKPDIIHCHDWHSGLIPFLLKKAKDPYFDNTRTLLTIHNIAYQGRFKTSYLKFLETMLVYDLTKTNEKINFLKSGIEDADFISTVSPYHAQEIRKGKVGFGLSQAIRHKRGRFVGILNGIDTDVWNPKRDSLIHSEYDRNNAQNGKKENKLYLQKKLGIEVDSEIPLFGFIARFVEQKGLSLLMPLLSKNPRRRIQIVLLGSGDLRIEHELKRMVKEIDPKWYSLTVKFDERLAHEIYAGSDYFLVPSLFEPCGLTQMIAMRYGSIPIVTDVGGLHDTVTDGDTGFVCEHLSPSSLATAIERASDCWENEADHKKMRDTVMKKDFSWKKSAKEYVRLYKRIVK